MKPIFSRKPRCGHEGEHAFAETWAEWCNKETTRENLFGESRPSLYAMRFFGSFALWLGTNCGRCFVESAKLDQIEYWERRSSILKAWAIENKRSAGINGGIRALEAILEGEPAGSMRSFRKLTADDFELAEIFVFWLASDDGMAFYAEASRRSFQAQRNRALPKHIDLADA